MTESGKSSWQYRIMPFASTVILACVLCILFVIENRTTEIQAEQSVVDWAPPLSDSIKSGTIKENATESPCERSTKPKGAASLPQGIIEETTDLRYRSMSADAVKEAQYVPPTQNLLAMAIGFKQKDSVNNIVQKFVAVNFTLMFFHYDGIVEAWNEYTWSASAVHVVAKGQTKWWYAKRFLHPDVVAPFKYIFLWDEDIGVENFNVSRYLDIVEEEGLQVSQPGLDRSSKSVHHGITARQPNEKVHRRVCNVTTNPRSPCSGWVEMMVPVFIQSAWRCTWYMIQNDLIHAWGLDFKLGYCVEGHRDVKVGVVDEQYVVHRGVESLGGLSKEGSDGQQIDQATAADEARKARKAVLDRSWQELDLFNKRWSNAAKEDKCWVDPY